MSIEPTAGHGRNEGRVRLDLSIEQGELLREGLLTLADQDAGRRFQWLALHEQILGCLTRAA